MGSLKIGKPEDTNKSPHPRLAGLDALKVIAIGGVMVIHVPKSPALESLTWQLFAQFCSFAVPCFFLISGYFFMRSWGSAENKNAIVIRYITRLALPFLFWALFYQIVPPFNSPESDGILDTIKMHLLNILQHPRSFLYTGFIEHLWFLSSLIQALLILSVCLRYGNLMCAVFIGGFYYCTELLGDLYANTPLGFHTHVDIDGPFVSTFFVAMGALIAQRNYKINIGGAIVLACVGFLLSLTEIWFLHSYYQLPLTRHNYTLGTSLLGLGIMFIALSWKNVNPWLAHLGIYSLGLYVIHPYIIELLKRIEIADLLSSLPLAFVVLIFVISLFLVMGLAKIKWMRRVVI